MVTTSDRCAFRDQVRGAIGHPQAWCPTPLAGNQAFCLHIRYLFVERATCATAHGYHWVCALTDRHYGRQGWAYAVSSRSSLASMLSAYRCAPGSALTDDRFVLVPQFWPDEAAMVGTRPAAPASSAVAAQDMRRLSVSARWEGPPRAQALPRRRKDVGYVWHAGAPPQQGRPRRRLVHPLPPGTFVYSLSLTGVPDGSFGGLLFRPWCVCADMRRGIAGGTCLTCGHPIYSCSS